VKLLLKRGTDPNRKSESGGKALVVVAGSAPAQRNEEPTTRTMITQGDES
jgi:hypothetical protein